MKVSGKHLGIKKPRIEMLPLIDIVFLLLIFFIYAMLSMAVHRSLPISLPVSSTAKIDMELSLTVAVRQNGEVFFEDKMVPLENLQSALQDRFQKAADKKSVCVELFADEAITYQELYRILDIITSAGISNVSLQADAK
ncbi:MAG: biopolymer transporter ExbD [Deltaproteobacteria bacterium]|jgi:biopolymer transport protein ExbD|nr:biopolymer transporter ExbD [Deltaproteobacteria bacterium]